MTVEIRETPIGGKVEPFIDVVDYIYRAEPNYVRPLDMDMKQRLSRKNPLFEHAEGTLFTAHRNGFCVGRVSATIDRGDTSPRIRISTCPKCGVYPQNVSCCSRTC